MAVDMTYAEPKITDVYVTLDMVHPKIEQDLKKPAIFVKGDQESYKTYTYLPDVQADYDVNSSVYKLAETLFGQNNIPEAIQVITFSDKLPAPIITAADFKDVDASNDNKTVDASSTTKTVDGTNNSDNNDKKDLSTIFNDVGNEPTSGIKRAVYDYFYNDWEFALLADYNKQDALDLATMLDHGGYDGKGFHLFFLQFDKDTINDSLDFQQFNRTWCLYHSDPTERYDGALVAEAATDTVGKVDWKFVSDLNGITPENLKAAQLNELTRNHLISYVQKSDHANQTTSRNAQGWYVDIVHGADFVKYNLEKNLQNALSLGGKRTFPFNTQGLNAIQSNMENTFKLCGDQGIIATDDQGRYKYHVNVPEIGKVPVSNIENRVLNGVTADFDAASSIDEVHIHVTETA